MRTIGMLVAVLATSLGNSMAWAQAACGETDRVAAMIEVGAMRCGYVPTAAGRSVRDLSDQETCRKRHADEFHAKIQVFIGLARSEERGTLAWCTKLLDEHVDQMKAFGMKPWMEKMNPQAIFNMGAHAGRVWFATTKCGGEISPHFKHAGGLARMQSEAAFMRGFKTGAADSERNHKLNGQSIGCLTSRTLYGPNGANVPNGWVPPPEK